MTGFPFARATGCVVSWIILTSDRGVGAVSLVLMVVAWLTGSAARRAERARRRVDRAAVRLAAIVGSCPDAIIGLAVDATIESWNVGAEHLYGYAAREAIGRPITIVNPPEYADHLEHFAAALAGRAVKLA